MMKIIHVAFFVLAFVCFGNGQNTKNTVAVSDTDKIYKAIYKAYKKAKAHDTAHYEGFFILRITNPFDPVYNKALTSSTDNLKTFADKVLSKLDKKSFPTIDHSTQQILIPIINFVKCKKHHHVKLDDFQRQIQAFFESENSQTTDSILVLRQLTITGYHN